MRAVEVEVVVVGGGVMGTAAALELSRRRHEVVLLERFEEGHGRGSSHGPTRIFRLSYPDPTYVLLARESLVDWRRLERDAGETLVETTGGLDLGPGAAACAEAMAQCGVPFEELPGAEVARRFPIDAGGARAVFQPETGVVAADRTVRVQEGLAAAAGASVRHGVRVEAIVPGERSVGVRTAEGGYEARTVVLAAGPWARPVAAAAGIDLPIVVTCEEVAYLRPSPPDLPVVIDWGEPVHYLAPARFGAPGMRVGLHHEGRVVDPEDGPFAPEAKGLKEVSGWVQRLIGAAGEVVSLETCLYSNTPNEDFILRRAGNIVVVSACSGHGFKFAPRIGRVVADLVEGKEPGLPARLASLVDR